MNRGAGLFSWLVPTLYLNFKCLPFRQARHLPIYVMRPCFYSLKGNLCIESEKISRGMIKIGFPETMMYPRKKTVIDIRGKIVFKGRFNFGNGGVLSVSEKGCLSLGDRVTISDNSKILGMHYIEFGDSTQCGWDCTFCDSDFHAMKNAFTEKKLRPFAPVIIGKNNWIAENVTILKGTQTPEYTTISSCSMVNRRFKCQEKSIIGGNPAELIAEGCYYRDVHDDSFDYIEYVKKQ